MYQFVRLSINFTIGLVASFNLYFSNAFVTSKVSSFSSERSHLSKIFSVLVSHFGSKLSIFA